jgi:uncharacterized SAM-binding protein YcdF (DUF218 family)
MFFILSKLLIFFTYPFSWFFAFFVAALIIKRQPLKRRLFITSAVLLLIFSNPFLINEFAHHWDIKPVPLKKDGTYSCAIVLGGFTSVDEKGNGYFNGAADRFLQGLKLLQTGKVSHILITGGNGMLVHDNFTEGDWAKVQLELLKVPDSCILVENKSRNTVENAAFSKQVLAQNHLQPPYLLVTSAYHMRRALGIFKTNKMDVIPFPCNRFAGDTKIYVDQFIPDGGVFGGWNVYIKEFFGVLVNWALGK